MHGHAAMLQQPDNPDVLGTVAAVVAALIRLLKALSLETC
jgi:hypothetical protein